MQIAAEHRNDAVRARLRGRTPLLAEVPLACHDEFHAALVAITASAFALDAFYLAIRELVPYSAVPAGTARSVSVLTALARASPTLNADTNGLA